MNSACVMLKRNDKCVLALSVYGQSSKAFYEVITERWIETMTVSTHVAEIARQGIWASLTGGWYYEPSHSIFCNTTHLYLWILLMLLPILLGFFSSGTFSTVLIAGYTLFIAVLYVILKFCVSYLHRLFDTSEPIAYTSKKKKKATATAASSTQSKKLLRVVSTAEIGEVAEESSPSVVSFSRDACDIGDIAMVEMGNRGNRTEDEPSDESENPTITRNVVEADVHNIEGNSSEMIDRIPERCRNLSRFLPADSLEFLPTTRRQSEIGSVRRAGFARKYSEPNCDRINRSLRSNEQISSSFDGRPFPVQRSNSMSDGRVLSTRLLLSSKRYDKRETTGSLKRRTSKRRSSQDLVCRDPPTPYPGNRKRTAEHLSDYNSTESTKGASVELSRCDSHSLKSKEGDREGDGHDEHDDEIDEEPQPGPSNLEKEKSDTWEWEWEREEHENRRLEEAILDLELEMSTRPSASMLRRTSERVNDELVQLGAGTLRDPMDLKVEITKFLEDLIEKHPETLDAIENVRMNRLFGRQAYSGDSSRNSASIRGTHNLLSNLAKRDSSTHIAMNHEDTSQGAVHSFQDEEGTWWTYAFDEQGVGTAQALGSSTAIFEMLNRHGSAPGPPPPHRIHATTTSHFRRRGDTPHVQVVDFEERDEESSPLEDDHFDPDQPSTSAQARMASSSTTRKTKSRSLGAAPAELRGTRASSMFSSSAVSVPAGRGHERDRTISTSSNESGIYIPDVPTSVYYAHHQQSSSLDAVSPAMARYALEQQMLRRAFVGGVTDRLRYFMQRRPSQLHGYLDSLPAGLDDQFDDPMHPVGNYMSMGLNYRPHFNNLNLLDAGNAARNSNSVARQNYYYRLKLVPKSLTGSCQAKGFKLKLNRLTLSALFDRNRHIFSCIVDVFIASLVSFLAAVLIAKGIYHDISLLLFAFVVAGSHFSLLKSVQPDAASPIHGFNWLVPYSRPVYFCFLASCICIIDMNLMDQVDSKASSDVIFNTVWTWNPYRLHLATVVHIFAALRELIAYLILLLPVAFTFGVLPQVNTMIMHLAEQIDMHFFGGTATFSLWSAVFQLTKSLFCVSLLSGLSFLAHQNNAATTQSALFSTFIAITVSTAFLMSRYSSNPALFVVWLRSLLPVTFRSKLLGSPHETKRPASSSRLSTKTDENRSDRDVSGAGPTVVSHSLNGNEDESSQSPVDYSTSEIIDPLPGKLYDTVTVRMRHDVLFSIVIALFVFALHCTSLFTTAQPYFQYIVSGVCFGTGFLNHYAYHQFRTHTPWKAFSKPFLRSHEYGQYETTVEARLMWFERLHIWMLSLERNILYPLLIVSTMTIYAWRLPLVPYVFSALIAFRLLRTAYSQPQMLYMPLMGALLLSVRVDDNVAIAAIDTGTCAFPVAFYLFAVLWPKVRELMLKMHFICAYIAPWQISWGSAFHAFAQPFSVPHSGLIFAQAFLSSIASAPLNPFLGSSFFLTSYVRPVKFWEKDYNTKRIDHSNLRLVAQIDRGPMMDDSNLNAVFYEHLTRSLQTSLAGDLAFGRWATAVEPGDCYILASFYLNCLVHIIEVGNGFVTFQLRGLEFRGTYCHQREVEAISEDATEGKGCCCCTAESLPGMLSFNTACTLRWLAWEVTAAKYVIDGYSITDNSAVNLLQVHELRRLLVSLYVKCIAYYATSSPKLTEWFSNETIHEALDPIHSDLRYADLDHMFCPANDEDYDSNVSGVSRRSFTHLHGSWIRYCTQKRFNGNTDGENQVAESWVVVLCFALSMVGRRALGTAAHNRHSNAAESFLYGLHALFKGDFRITSPRDEWVFADMDLLKCVISPGVRMALKLHQDHFAAVCDFEDIAMLYERIQLYQSKLFISHEHDPAWRQAIISNTPSLLALRHVYDDGQDDYKVIMLNKMHLNMRVIKLNRECVRAFWSGQQQELIFLRNRNPERGSIQNARQVLRNMINSSADQPIGYPIYVSPLTTSFVETHPQIDRVVGPPITFDLFANAFRRMYSSLRAHFGTSGSSNINFSGTTPAQSVPQHTPVSRIPNVVPSTRKTDDEENENVNVEAGESQQSLQSGADGKPSISRESVVQWDHPLAEQAVLALKGDGTALVRRPGAPLGMASPSNVNRKMRMDSQSEAVEMDVFATSVENVTEEEEMETKKLYAQIIDASKVNPTLNVPLRATGECLVSWPSHDYQRKGGKSGWKGAVPENGMYGVVVHQWRPFHPMKIYRSFAGHIYLLELAEMNYCYVPITEDGLRFIDCEQYLQESIFKNRPEGKEEGNATVHEDPKSMSSASSACSDEGLLEDETIP
uniref:Pecanex-like protein n=1 Tax=Steinernema glaseri TaxID=37863 RepID=A0A1I7Z4I6_9BILA